MISGDDFRVWATIEATDGTARLVGLPRDVPADRAAWPSVRWHGWPGPRVACRSRRVLCMPGGRGVRSRIRTDSLAELTNARTTKRKRVAI